jgi:DNA-binding NarL/FixJ family response regulator
MITVLVVDSDEVFRAGICSILRGSGRIEVVAEAGNGNRLVEMARQHRPDVLIIDMQIDRPDGVRAIQRLKHERLPTRVIVLSAVIAEFVGDALKAGVAGLLDKTVSPSELINAVIGVAASESVILSASSTRCMIDGFLRFDQGRTRLARRKVEVLTAREREVLGHVLQGLGNSKIARTMHVSEGAVKAHVSHVLAKLGCVNRVQAAIVAHDSDLFRVPSDSEVTRSIQGLSTLESIHDRWPVEARFD